MKELMSNVLPYLQIEPKYTEKEAQLEEVKEITVPNFIGLDVSEAKKFLIDSKIKYKVEGEGTKIRTQFPPENEVINYNQEIILYTD